MKKVVIFEGDFLGVQFHLKDVEILYAGPLNHTFN
jgi:hypothetical protein